MAEAVHIVLVSDAAAARRRMAHVLGRAGWLVTETWHADGCLELLRRGEVQVVVLDLAHPGEGGRSLLSEIVGGFPEVPLVATGADDVQGAVQAMQRGACDYVAQYDDGRHLTDLPQAVWRALGRRRRLRTHRRAHTEPETLATALRGMTDGVAIVDSVGRVSYVNPALAAAWGTPPPQIVGRPMEEFVSVPGDGDEVAAVLARAEEAGRWKGQLRPRRSVEGPGVWDVTLTPILRPKASSALVGIFRDPSERSTSEQSRSDFLSMVTHDIKSPLSVILGYTDLLVDGGAPPAMLGELLGRIRESGEQINALVSNFLELSRIEAGRFQLDRRPVDVQALLDRIVDQHGSRAARKGVALGYASQPVPSIDADVQYLERAVVNVLSNAIKYTPSGGCITVAGAAEADGRVALRVTDTGPGIAPEELPSIFEKYRRARSVRRTEGTGLGLFIARAIVDAHGGEIRVDSAPGRGATFTILLPR